MHCTNCGTLLEDNAKFCQSCGAPVNKPAPAPAPQPEPIPQPAPVPQPAPIPQPAPVPQPAPAPQQNPYSQADFQQTPYGQQNGQQPFGQSATAAKPLPMKWYKFVIYVQLFLAAVISLGNAVLYITGMQYGDNKDFIRSYFPGLGTLDIIFGILYIAMAVFCIVTRQKLAHFKKGAPGLYFVVLVLNTVLSIIYSAAATVIIGASVFDASTFSTVGGLIILLILNIIYFNKRKHLFVN